MLAAYLISHDRLEVIFCCKCVAGHDDGDDSVVRLVQIYVDEGLVVDFLLEHGESLGLRRMVLDTGRIKLCEGSKFGVDDVKYDVELVERGHLELDSSRRVVGAEFNVNGGVRLRISLMLYFCGRANVLIVRRLRRWRVRAVDQRTMACI